MVRRVFLVDDHHWLLEIQARVLGMEDDIEVCGMATSAEAALATLPEAVDVLVVDLALPGMGGLDLIREVHARRPGLACVVLSAQPAVEVEAAALDAGAAAYVEKGDSPSLYAAIRAAVPAPPDPPRP